MNNKYSKGQNWHDIERPEESREYLEARSIAGRQLQSNFVDNENHWGKGFHWVKAELTSPSSDDLTFGYKNQVFSVLIDFVKPVRHLFKKMTLESLTSQKRLDDFLTAARENNLVPCLFPIYRDGLKPLTAMGRNLLHAETHKWIHPEAMASDERTPMSKWELNNFAIQVVRQYIEKDGNKILSFCDVLGVEPQVWFENKKGERCWVVVKHITDPEDNDYHKWIGLEDVSSTLKDYDGFFAGVGFRNAEDFGLTLYRGEGAMIKFDGLQRVFLTDMPKSYKNENTAANKPTSPKLKHMLMLSVLQVDKFDYTESHQAFVWKDGELYCSELENMCYAIVFIWLRYLAKTDSTVFENLFSWLMNCSTSSVMETMALKQDDMISDIRRNFTNFSSYSDIGNFSDIKEDMQKNLVSWMYIDNKSLSSLIKSFGDRLQNDMMTNMSRSGSLFGEDETVRLCTITNVDDAYEMMCCDLRDGNIKMPNN